MEGRQREEEELSGLGEELDGGSDRQGGVEMALRTPTGVGVPPPEGAQLERNSEMRMGQREGMRQRAWFGTR